MELNHFDRLEIKCKRCGHIHIIAVYKYTFRYYITHYFIDGKMKNTHEVHSSQVFNIYNQLHCYSCNSQDFTVKLKRLRKT